MSEAVLTNKKRKLPSGWRWARLGDVCEFLDHIRKPISAIERAKRNEGKSADELFPYYGANGQAGWIDEYLFDEPLILLAEDGGAFGSPDIPIAYKIEGKTWVNNHAHVLRPHNDVDFDYLLFSISIRPDLAQVATGNTRPKLNQAIAAGIPVPLPPFQEQKRISKILKEQMLAVDKARVAAEVRLEAVEALPASFLRQVFPKQGQQLPTGWHWVKLGEVCDVMGGSTPETANPDFWNGDIVWITPTDLGKLSDVIITQSTRQITLAGLQGCGTSIVPAGTVIMSSRAPIGHLAIAGVPLCTNQGCKSFVLRNGIDSIFMYWILKQAVPDIQALGSGATFTEVSKISLQAFEIPLPSLPEQQRIAVVLKEQMTLAKKTRIAAEDELEVINALPAALLRRAFNGEI